MAEELLFNVQRIQTLMNAKQDSISEEWFSDVVVKLS